MRVSDCCGASNLDFEDYGICPECREHCEFTEVKDEEPEIMSLVEKMDLFRNCSICLQSGSSEIMIKQNHVADLMSSTGIYVARIKVSSIKPKP